MIGLFLSSCGYHDDDDEKDDYHDRDVDADVDDGMLVMVPLAGVSCNSI